MEKTVRKFDVRQIDQSDDEVDEVIEIKKKHRKSKIIQIDIEPDHNESYSLGLF